MTPLLVPTLGVSLAVFGCEFFSGKKSEPRPDRPPVAPTEPELVEVGTPWPAGELEHGNGSFVFAVFASPGFEGDLRATAQEVKKASFPELTLAQAAKDAGPGHVLVSTPPIEEFAPPDAEAIEFLSKGLDETMRERATNSERVIIFEFDAAPAQRERAYRQALRFTDAVVAEVGGFPWDDHTRQVFSPDAWKARLNDDAFAPTTMQQHFVIHAYRVGETLRLCSLGLEKFGLPNLVVEQVTPADGNAMVDVVNAVAATMLVTRRLEREGELDVDVTSLGFEKTDESPGKDTVFLAAAERDEGDPQGPLIEIVFPGTAEALHVRHNRLIDNLQGVEDGIEHVEHDEEVLAAVEVARKKLLALKPSFEEGVPDMTSLLVKGPFQTADGGNEWMWIDVHVWEGAALRGVLVNEPFNVPGLKAGAKVEVEEAEVFDFKLKKPDGTVESGGSTEVLTKKIQAEQGQ